MDKDFKTLIRCSRKYLPINVELSSSFSEQLKLHSLLFALSQGSHC